MMNKLLIFLILIPALLFSQPQINYTYGQKTTGVYWTQVGNQYWGGGATLALANQIIVDLQDYYPLTYSDYMAIAYTSYARKTFIGTLWYRFDAKNATDSVNYIIIAKSANMIYNPNDGSRVTAANLHVGTDSTILVSVKRAVNDTQWKFTNVFLNDSKDANGRVARYLPPEFVDILIKGRSNCADSINVYWNFAYPAMKENEQDQRSTSQDKGESRKRKKTLH
jgi:hypothetical protein